VASNNKSPVELMAEWLLETDTVRNDHSAKELAPLVLRCRHWGQIVDLLKSRDMCPKKSERYATALQTKLDAHRGYKMG
jgi:hypothetical protein